MTSRTHILIAVFAALLLSIIPQAASANVPSKEKIGLNVHWALAGFGRDDLYEQRLRESGTQWVREHFNHDAFAAAPDAWYARYDDIIGRYKRLGIHVVGMLAYNPVNKDYREPDPTVWADFVHDIVKRYGNTVRVWEVWNEPDNFLSPATPEAFAPVISTAYDAIKSTDPGATVLNGGISWPSAYWVRRIYQLAGDKFDRLAFHVYYCDHWVDDGDNRVLFRDLAKVKAVIDTYDPGQMAWVTELGCSTNTAGIDAAGQRDYLAHVMADLVNFSWIEKVFLFSMRQPNPDPYEWNFSLLRPSDMSKRLSWEWYEGLPAEDYDAKYSYGVPRDLTLQETKAAELKRELEHYFGVGTIPVPAERWPFLVEAYAYGGYPVKAIVQALRFGGYTVHSTKPWSKWKNSDSYKAYINRDWTGDKITFAYDKPRRPLPEEQQLAQEIKNQLAAQFDLSHLHIDPTNWATIVNAYIYGEYPIEAIARAIRYGGKTVHPSIGWSAWKSRPEYAEYISKPLD